MRDSDFHCNFFHYPKRRQESVVVVESQPQMQRHIRRSSSNLEVHNQRIAQKLEEERRKIAEENKVTRMIQSYAYFRRNGMSGFEARDRLIELFHDVQLCDEIYDEFEACLDKFMSQHSDSTAIVLVSQQLKLKK
jgi:hypothetical protein